MTAVLDKPLTFKPISAGEAIKIKSAGEFHYSDNSVIYTVNCDMSGWNAAMAKVAFEVKEITNLVPVPAALTHTEIADHLERALGLLHANGWTQNTMRDNQGHICAGYAISGAQQARHSLPITVRSALLAFLNEGRHYPNRWPTVPVWNDVPGRTFEEIRDGFQGAIDRERKLAAEAGELP